MNNLSRLPVLRSVVFGPFDARNMLAEFEEEFRETTGNNHVIVAAYNGDNVKLV